MKPVIEQFIKNGFLISPELLQRENLDPEAVLELIRKKISEDKPTIINDDLYLVLTQTNAGLNINWREFERTKALLEKGNDGKGYYMFLDIMEYNISPEKKEIMDELLGE